MIRMELFLFLCVLIFAVTQQEVAVADKLDRALVATNNGVRDVDKLLEQLKRGPADENAATVLHGSALVGVDSLGRIAIAFDVNEHGQSPDGEADYFVLFTAFERLGGPWQKQLDKATLVVTVGNVTLTSTARELALSATVGGYRHKKAPEGFAEQIEVSDGLGMSRLVADEPPTPMSSISHADIGSWPSTFAFDALDLGTASTCATGAFSNCSSGGPYSSTCNIAGCPGAPDLCNTTCNVSQNSHACCGCNAQFGDPPPASCQCIWCIVGGGQIP